MKRLASVLLLALALPAFAIPQLINYQGELTRPDGSPLDTTVAMTFRLYPVPVGGALSWTESYPSVVVTDGLFSVLLGSISVLTDQFAVDRWLGVTVGNNLEMTPRQRVSSVAHAYRVGTVDGAGGGAISSDVVISGKLNVGGSNTNPGDFAVVHGENNRARGNFSVVSGGGGASLLDSNSASGNNSTIAGGKQNQANGLYSSIGGGQFNSASHFGIVAGGAFNAASGTGAAILGGASNTANAQYASVGGGASNNASGTGSTVGGGTNNIARGNYSLVAGGGGANAADSNSAAATYSVVGGGGKNLASGLMATVGGGYENWAVDTITVIAGGRFNEATRWGAAIGGGYDNNSAGMIGTVAGGSGNSVGGTGGSVGGGANNIAAANYAVIAGGLSGWAYGDNSAIGGGWQNTAGGSFSTVSGGHQNSGTGQESSVIGGFNNLASGLRSVVLGGQGNEASGSYSCALGNNSHAVHPGAFVWGDGWGTNLTSSANDQFSARASGGYRLYTNNSHTSGVTMAAGGNAWVVVSDSTKKRAIRQTDTHAILNKVASLPIKNWEYKSEAEGTNHIGPMAQDFWNAFQLGSDSLGISTIDADGILFAAVQELARQNDKLQTTNDKQEEEITELRALVQTLLADRQESSLKERK